MYTQPVTDSVPKINNELAVGEDLRFQNRWWKFERVTWMVFGVLILLDLLGAFGRGPLAKASASAGRDAMQVEYERIERAGTPSMLRIQFGKSAIHNGKIQLWVSGNLVNQLGNQRVVPQPATSQVGEDGILYTFPATQAPGSAGFALQPEVPGMHHLRLRVPGTAELRLGIFVVP